MSWCSHITTVRPIDMADARDIVASMSPDLAGEGAGRQQAWGWSCAVDVHYPLGTGWGIGGHFWMPFDYVLNSNLSDDFWVLYSVEDGDTVDGE